MLLYYNHKKRQVFKRVTGNTLTLISIEEAKQACDDGIIEDGDLAFRRLVDCDFDMEKVEAELQRILRLWARDPWFR